MDDLDLVEHLTQRYKDEGVEPIIGTEETLISGLLTVL